MSTTKNSIHGVIIALAILNAVGLLVMYFKLDMVDASLKMAQRQTSEQMDVLQEMIKPTEGASTITGDHDTGAPEDDMMAQSLPQPALFPYGTYAFLKPGQMVWIGATHGEVTGQPSKIGELTLVSVSDKGQATISLKVIDTGKTEQHLLNTRNAKACAETSLGGITLAAYNSESASLFLALGCGGE